MIQIRLSQLIGQCLSYNRPGPPGCTSILTMWTWAPLGVWWQKIHNWHCQSKACYAWPLSSSSSCTIIVWHSFLCTNLLSPLQDWEREVVQFWHTRKILHFIRRMETPSLPSHDSLSCLWNLVQLDQRAWGEGHGMRVMDAKLLFFLQQACIETWFNFFLQHYDVLLQVAGVFSKFRPRVSQGMYLSLGPILLPLLLECGTALFGPIECKQLLTNVSCVSVHSRCISSHMVCA